MKKLLFTMVFATAAMFASAQFMVVTTIEQPGDGEDWGMENFTDNIGIGYEVNEKLTVGVARDKHTEDDGHDHDHGDDEDGFKLFARYNLMDMFYVSLDMPTEDATDNMNIGGGLSFNIWNSLYLEPSYTMPVNEDDNGDREGSFNFGISYKF